MIYKTDLKKLDVSQKILFISKLIFYITIYMRNELEVENKIKKNYRASLQSINELNHVLASQLMSYVSKNAYSFPNSEEFFLNYIEEMSRNEFVGEVIVNALKKI